MKGEQHPYLLEFLPHPYFVGFLFCIPPLLGFLVAVHPWCCAGTARAPRDVQQELCGLILFISVCGCGLISPNEDEGGRKAE